MFPHFPQAAPQDSGPHHLLRNVVPKYTILHLWPNMTWEIGHHPSSPLNLGVFPLMGLSGLKQGGEKLPLVLSHLPCSPSWPLVVTARVQGIEKATTNVYKCCIWIIWITNHYSWFFEPCWKMWMLINAHPSVEVNLYQIRWESKQSQMSSPQSAGWGFLKNSNQTSIKPSDLGPQNLFCIFPPPKFSQLHIDPGI